VPHAYSALSDIVVVYIGKIKRLIKLLSHDGAAIHLTPSEQETHESPALEMCSIHSLSHRQV